LDHHIERLETKLSFLIRSYDDSHSDLLYENEEKIATIEQEIDEAKWEKRSLNRVRQKDVVSLVR